MGDSDEPRRPDPRLRCRHPTRGQFGTMAGACGLTWNPSLALLGLVGYPFHTPMEGGATAIAQVESMQALSL
jgi:hypothetical protein